MSADRPLTPSKSPLLRATASNESSSISPQNSNTKPSHRASLTAMASAHRPSFSDSFRGPPASPRASRQQSIGQGYVQELWNNPPQAHKGENPYAGRDWKTIRVGEIIDPGQVHFAEMDTSVEEATHMLVSIGSPNVILVRENPSSRVAIGTFSYSDLNSYLLLVVGLAQPDSEQVSSFNELTRKGREGEPIPLRDIKDLGRKEPIVSLPHTAYLSDAVEKFGSGIHRILVCNEGTMDTVGVLTQLRLVSFFWDFGKSFPAIERLYTFNLRDLQFGTQSVLSINGDKPLSEALEMMHSESITSLPVLDHQRNVIGNISHVDVRLLTKSSSLPLLRQSCIHFISVILSERGMIDGKDSFPVFYVNPFSSLAHTTAKLVATRSHRMWIVNDPSPASSAPQTPAHPTAPPAFLDGPSPANAKEGPPYPANISALIAGQNMSGRLCGVISLTDVLNLFGRASGLSPDNPNEARRRRRRSSSSSMRAASMDSARSSTVDLRRSSSGRGQRPRTPVAG